MLKNWSGVSFISLALFFLFSAALVQAESDPLRASLFEHTEQVMARAKDVNAELMAPTNYAEGLDAYEKASKRYSKKQSVDKIKKDLATAESYFNKAIEGVELAKITFNSSLKARKDAQDANAESMSTEEWLKAEKQLKSAAEYLETDSLEGALKKSNLAESIYREAELLAIKASYLSQTREVIAQAKKNKVDRYAPDTLKKAQQLLEQAEKELSENRYDTDYPRSLAKQSFYQAKHSIYLADYIKQLKADDVTTEQLLLKMEEPLTEIAGAMDIVAEFDQGVAAPTGKVKAKVEDLLLDSHELQELKAQMGQLEEDYAGLEQRLGIQSKRLAAQEEQRKKLEEINRLFTPQEAIVLTQGDKIIIRAVGLSFEAGSSTVNTSDINLLEKLQKVFKVFRDYDVVVEGHTDSFGSDSANLSLSLNRANAVREYFVVNMPGFSEERSSAKGYGETQPIANNETAAGRQKNRRIDLVLIPH